MGNRNFAKRVFIIIVGLFISVIIVAFSLVYIYEDKIKSYSIEQINKSINARIDVEKISLSFFSQLPKASLDFHNISFYDNSPKAKSKLPIIKSEKIFLSFNILDLLNNNYNLQEITIKNAQVNLDIYKNGSNNFSFLNSSNNDDSSEFLLSLNAVSFINTQFNYSNEATKQSFEVLIRHSKVKGVFSDKKIALDLKGETILKSFYNQSRLIVSNRSIGLDVATSFNIEKDYYSLERGILTYDGIPMKLSGDIQLYNNSIGINAKLNAKKLSYSDIAKNLDKEVLSQIKKYNLAGLFSLDVGISGRFGGKIKPHISADISMENVKADIEEFNLSFEDVSLKLKYNNGKGNTLKNSSIIIKELKGNSNVGNFEGNIKIKNLWRPKLKAVFKGNYNLEELSKVFMIDTIESITGSASASTWLNLDFIYSNEKEKWNIANLNFDNNFDIQKANLVLKNSDIEYSSINTKGRVENNRIIIYNLTSYVQGSKLSALGSVYNLPYSDFYVKNSPIVMNLTVQADNLSYDKVMDIIPKSSDNSDSRFSNDLDIIIDLDIDKFKYENIDASNLNGRFQMRNRRLSFLNINANTIEGLIEGMLWIDGSKDGKYELFSKGITKGLDITKAFEIFNNFGQQTVTSKNISGSMNSKYELKCSFDSDWKINTNSIELNSDMIVTDGVLRDINALNALKSYTKIDDFSELKFSELKNNITILNSQITIPEMQVNSNKMNISTSGIHKFDNSYEYHFTVLLSDVMGEKYKQTISSEFGEVENDGYGRTKLFFTLIGKGEEFTVEYDKTGLSKKLKADLQEEKNSLKKALNEEFGWFKTKDSIAIKDTINTTKQKRKEEDEIIKKQEGGEFIIEWDDE